MKKLERSEMKNLMGGIVTPPVHIENLVGWRLYNGQCWCDFYNAAAPEDATCNVRCPVSMCTAGSLDPTPGSV